MSEKTMFRFAYSLCESARKEEAEIMIYSDIVSWKWDKDDPEVTAAEFDRMLKQAKKDGAKKLRLRINSPGGHVDQAVAMKTMLEGAGFDEINVDIEGLCASAATFFVCVPNAHVRIANGSEFMIHNPWAGCVGTAADFFRTAQRMEKMENTQHTMYAQRTGQTEDQIKAWMDAESWFTAKEAVDYGFADEITNAPAVAACVSAEALEMMKGIYNRVPDGVRAEAKARANNVRNTEPVGNGEVTENNDPIKEGENNMDIKEITEQMLEQGNPDLFNSIREQGIKAERERMQQIDALTDEGFEGLAQQAKESGWSAAEFLQKVVAERQGKKKEFLTNRAKETAPAASVQGGSAADNDGSSEADEITRNAKEMAELAKAMAPSGGAMF